MIRLTEGRELLSSQGSWKTARVTSQGGRKEAKSYSCIPPVPGDALRGPSSRAVNLDRKQKFNQTLFLKRCWILNICILGFTFGEHSLHVYSLKLGV